MAAGLVVALILWHAMGSLIVRERIPAFIITLGGLLAFKGLFWMVIRSQTVPVAPGGGRNLYSLLTTYYLPPVAGYWPSASSPRWPLRGPGAGERLAYGLPTEDGED